MFTISYTQKKNQPTQVTIQGSNPYNSADKFSDIIIFNTECEAKGFCLLLSSIEAAISSRYSGRCAVILTDDAVDITTETVIPTKDRVTIRQRVKQAVSHVSYLKYVQFYALETC